MKKRMLYAIAALAVALLLFYLIPKGPRWVAEVFSYVWLTILLCAVAYITGIYSYIKKRLK